jgi:hypothetical protein
MPPDNTPVVFRVRTLTRSEHAAVKACFAGEATAHQQLTAMAIIVKDFAGVHDQSYIPGSDRDTAFKEGRRFVGQQILKYNTLPVSQSNEEEVPK